MNDRDFIAALDVCRQAADPSTQPELADVAARLKADPAARALFQKLLKFDSALKTALREAAPPAAAPPGLAARLLDRLAALEPTADAPPTPQVDLPSPLPLSAPSSWVRVHVRSLSALAAVLLVAVSFALYVALRPLPLTDEDLRAAPDWFASVDQDSDWRVWPQSAAPTDLPFPEQDLRYLPGRWTSAAPSIGRRAVVYDLDLGRGGPRAQLFAIPQSEPLADAPSTPPVRPQSMTAWSIAGGMTVAYWQREDVLYVLVVQGDERDYRRYLDPTDRGSLG